MENQKIIKEILLHRSKGFQKFLVNQTEMLAQAKKRADEEWSLKGNSAEGRKKKELMVEASNYTIGYITALSDIIPEMLSLLDKSEAEIILELKAERAKEKHKKKAEKLKIKSEIAKSKIIYLQNPHDESCPAYGTSKEWAVDKSCECPGASVIRKRMKKGDTLKAAKKYLEMSGIGMTS